MLRLDHAAVSRDVYFEYITAFLQDVVKRRNCNGADGKKLVNGTNVVNSIPHIVASELRSNFAIHLNHEGHKPLLINVEQQNLHSFSKQLRSFPKEME